MKYLLLRDNKQGGPYSLDELKTMGLKAYDLVWVEGKSAAWRYPCEIAELSSFAPVVEEQPFDRFFKKPSAIKTTDSSAPFLSSQPAERSLESSSGSTNPSTSSHPGDFSSTQRKRNIYVTMPINNPPLVIREASLESGRKAVVDPMPAIADRFVKPEPANSDFSNRFLSSSGGKQKAVEIMPHRKRQSRRGILQSVAVGLLILVLLSAGIFIGLSINKESPGVPKISSKTVTADNGRPIGHNPAQQLPVSPVVSPPAPSLQNLSITRSQVLPGTSSRPEATITNPAGKLSKTTLQKGKSAGPKTQDIVPVTVSDSTVGSTPADHREAIHRQGLMEGDHEPEKQTIKVELNTQVSIGASEYVIGTFGGISQLQLTVTNRSPYTLDLVVVAVQYILANKKTYKTENLYFRGIGPGSALMEEAPKSPRGIKVQYKITLINSKESGLSESGL